MTPLMLQGENYLQLQISIDFITFFMFAAENEVSLDGLLTVMRLATFFERSADGRKKRQKRG